MTWRRSTSLQDKVLSSLPYLIPILESLAFGLFLFVQFPVLQFLLIPFVPLSAIYFFSIGGIPLVRFALFFGLYAGVVRNEDLNHFLRFNTMQALLLSIVIALCSLAVDLLGILRLTNLGFSVPVGGAAAPVVIVVLFGTIFLGAVGTSIFSIVQSLRGLYPELPIISEAAYAQTR